MSTYTEYSARHQADIDAGLVDTEQEKRIMFESLLNHYFKGLGLTDMKQFILEKRKTMTARFYKEYFDEICEYILHLTANFELDVRIHALQIELGEINPETEKDYLREKIVNRLRFGRSYSSMKKYLDQLSKDFFAQSNKIFFDELCKEVLDTCIPDIYIRNTSPTQTIKSEIKELFKEYKNPNGVISDMCYLKYKSNKEILIAKK